MEGMGLEWHGEGWDSLRLFYGVMYDCDGLLHGEAFVHRVV